MTRWTYPPASLLTVAFLAACSGSTSPGNDVDPPAIADYLDFNDATTTATTTLGGQSVNNNSGVIAPVAGTLAHNTRALTGFATAGVTLTDSDGDVAGVWTDGTSTLSPLVAELGTYDFAALYQLQGASTPATLVVGAVTRAADVPATGTLSFAGDALVQGTSLNGALTAQGNSTVTVNLPDRTAVVTVNGVSGVAYDQMTLSGVTLSADRTALSGATIALSSGGADVTTTLLGADAASSLAGNFFGRDAANLPDEAGGVFRSAGQNGELSGVFLAD